MLSETLQALSQHPLYASAHPEVLARLAAHCTKRVLQPKEVLYPAGAPAQSVFLLTKGMVRVFQRGPDGLENTITTLVAPNSFGEKAVIAQSRGERRLGYPECTSALTEVSLLEMPANEFLDFIHASPPSAFELLYDICCRFTESARREVDVMVPVAQRLASLILSYATIAGVASSAGTVIKLPLTNAELASGIGAVTRSVARVLSQWNKQGVVRRHKGWLLLRDPRVLANICGGALLHTAYSSPQSK